MSGMWKRCFPALKYRPRVKLNTALEASAVMAVFHNTVSHGGDPMPNVEDPSHAGTNEMELSEQRDAIRENRARLALIQTHFQSR